MVQNIILNIRRLPVNLLHRPLISRFNHLFNDIPEREWRDDNIDEVGPYITVESLRENCRSIA